MLVELRDREVIAAHCRRRAALHAYLLGDLDDFFWPYTQWFAWAPNGRVEQLALLYSEPDPPVLLALGDPPVDAIRPLLETLVETLPERVYAHLTSPGLDALTRAYEPESRPAEHLRLGLASTDRLVTDDVATTPLAAADLPALEELYAAAYPETWFQPRMLETGRYLGVREQGRLVCVAGVHVHSPRFGVAVLGNVATHPAARGRGLATAVCGRLCRVLLDDGIDTIALNVRADNAAAIRAYGRLGFTPVVEFVEVMLRRRQP